MLARIRPRMTYANVMATIAVFIAIGGTSVAASIQLTRDSVRSSHVRDGTLRSGDIRRGAIERSDLAKRAVGPKQLALNGVYGGHVADGSLHGYDVADGTLAGVDVADGTLRGVDVADGSIDASDIKDGVLAGEFRGSAAGGDLTGTYPSPSLRDGAVGLPNLTQSLLDPGAGEPGLRTLGAGANQAAAGDDPRIPTQAQTDALAGTSGTPGAGNPFVTDADARLTDARTPTGSAGGDLNGSYPNPSIRPGAVGSSEVANASLRLGDTAVFTALGTLTPTTLPGGVCAVVAPDLGFDVQAGDLLEVYTVSTANGGVEDTWVQWSAGIQDDADTLDATACNPRSGDADVGGTIRFVLYRP